MTAISKLKAALGLARGERGTAAEIEAALGEARTALTSAQGRLGDAEASYRTALLDPDAKVTIAAHDALKGSQVALDRAEALVASLEQRLTEARAAEAEAQRREAHAKVRAARDALIERFEREYGSAATTIRALLVALQQDAEACRIVNANLPSDAGELVPAEMIVTGSGALPEEIISERVVQRWVYASTGHILDDERASQVRETEKGRGLLLAGSSHQADVVKRGFKQITFKAARIGSHDRLADALKLPDLATADNRITQTRFEPLEPTLRAVA